MSILAAVDFSENSYAALRTAARLARRDGREMVAMHSLEQADEDAFWRHLVETPWEVPERMREVAQARLVEKTQELLSAQERPEQLACVVQMHDAADGVLRAADEHDAELIVVGATGAGRLRTFLLGSSAERIIATAAVPVLAVASDATPASFGTILAPVDFSASSRASLKAAIGMARRDGSKLLVMHAFALPAAGLALLDMQAPSDSVDAYEQRKWAELDDFVDQFDLDGVDCSRLLRISSPVAAIRDVVDEYDVDLVCLGTHGRRGVERFLLGSTAARTLRRPPCSVLTVPDPQGPATTR